MTTYNQKDKLELTHKVYVTKEVYEFLRKEKKKQKISMAKIVCNLILEQYDR